MSIQNIESPTHWSLAYTTNKSGLRSHIFATNSNKNRILIENKTTTKQEMSKSGFLFRPNFSENYLNEEKKKRTRSVDDKAFMSICMLREKKKKRNKSIHFQCFFPVRNELIRIWESEEDLKNTRIHRISFGSFQKNKENVNVITQHLLRLESTDCD